MLKQLIQRLLDSRTTPSEASHSSYPDDGTVTQFSPSATSVSSWTKVVDSTIAPSDGYVIVRGKATGESYVQITAGDNPPHMERSTFAKATLNQYPILNLPIAKGKTFKVFAENTAEITVGLIKSICGGGYNYVVRRALSCLRPSFNCLQKIFSRVKRSGYLSGQSNCLTPRQSLKYQRQTLGQSSQCRLTVGQLLKAQTILQRRLTATSLKGNTKCSVFASVVSPTALQQFLFRAKKVKPSALPFTQTVRTFPLEHLKHFHLANLQTGGASC